LSIVLERVSKRFDGAAVIDEVSLEIADGELFVLLGASGSGKSTILRMIAGLTPIDGGRILMRGKRVDDLPAQQRGVGFVFQNYSLFRHMTVAENIEFGLKIRAVARKERAKRCEDLLAVVGLAGLGDRYPSQLSGGQMQRVALARALAYEPTVLLLDEPFGALDVKIRGQLRQSLKAIQRELKVTTILVTHDQEEAFELGDRIGVMEGGHLLEVGRPVDLYRRPANEYVATFVGSGNVIAGRVDAGRIRLGQVELDLPADVSSLAPGASVSVLCRPEEIDLARDPGELTGTVLGRARVVDRMFAGASERLFLRLPELRGAHPIFPAPAFGEEGTVLQALVRPEGPGETLPAVGDEYYVSLRSFHVFAHRGMRVLVCSDGSPHSELAISFGIVLAQALDGPAVLLGVAASPDDEPRLGAWLKDVARPAREVKGAEIAVRTRVGNAAEEIQAELEEHPYELVILGSAGGASLGETASRVARALYVPVLIVPSPRPAIRRILICTALGEPGKADIEFGGRIARRAGASVTILHVRPESSRRVDLAASEEAAISRDLQPAGAAHLEKGLKTLDRLTVTGQVKVRYGHIVDEIFAEAESGDYDLIVIGAHGGGARGRPPRPADATHDIAHAVVSRARLPVLMVPLRPL
jgi:sulfate transport system ATP-binding protein